MAHGQAPCGACSGASERSTPLSGSGSGGGVLEPELGGGTSVLPLHAPAATSTSHTHPLKAHAQLCVLGSLEKPALSGRKPGVAVMVASGKKRHQCGESLSPLTPQQRGPHGGPSRLSTALEGCRALCSPPTREDGGRCGVRIPTMSTWPLCGDTPGPTHLVTVLHTGLSSHQHGCSSRFLSSPIQQQNSS